MGVTADQNMVLDAVRRATGGESGAGIADLCAELRTRCTEARIRQALDWLTNEGHVYSTIDDDHYKVTDG